MFNVKFYEQKYQTFSHGQYLFVQISAPKQMWKIFEITCYLWNIKWLGSTLPYNRFSMNVHLHKLLNSRDTQKTRPKNKAKKEWIMFLQSTVSKFERNNYNRGKNVFFPQSSYFILHFSPCRYGNILAKYSKVFILSS